MPITNPELWRAISRYEFPSRVALTFRRSDATSSTFEKDLEASLDVTAESASRMVKEYRRFLYLKAIDGGVLTPPKHVDDVWHAHINLPDGAWDDFCSDVVGKKVEHRIDLSSKQTVAAYERTVALYRDEFEGLPPADIWPGRAARARSELGLFLVIVGVVVAFGGHFLQAAVNLLPSAFPSMLATGELFWIPYTFWGGFALIVAGVAVSHGTEVPHRARCG